MKTISIIVPCYNEQENIPELYKRVVQTFAQLSGFGFELIFVDNHSTDNSQTIFQTLGKKDRRVKAITMSRNFGSPQPSFLAGLSVAQGDAALLLHGDIQDPPEMLPKFIAEWEQGYHVVYGVRTRRDGYGIVWNFYYKFFYWLLSKLAYIDIPLNAGEFSLISRRVIDELLAIPEYDYNLRCLRAFVGFSQKGVPYVREARKHGKSTENFIRGLYWAKTIILNFSFKPLTMISWLGMAATMLSVVYFFVSVGLVLVFHERAPGIPTVIVLVLFFGGVQLISLSVIAEYIAKIFLEVKRRPQYIIETAINIDKKLLQEHQGYHV